MSRLNNLLIFSNKINKKEVCIGIFSNNTTDCKITWEICTYRGCSKCAAYKPNLDKLNESKIKVEVTYE